MHMMQFDAQLLALEMRLKPGTRTQNLDAFMQQLHQAFPDKQQALDALENIIIESKCPEIRFENLAVLGISMADACIINQSILKTDFQNAMYIILHEIAHQMQYSKHGEDFAAGIFLNNIPDQQLINTLRKIELTADRYAIAKLKQIFNAARIPMTRVPQSIYKQIPDATLHQHIQKTRRAVKQHKLTSTQQINDWIYNSIKIAL